MSISAVILAGGKSSRMGQDKALMPFGKFTTLSEYQYKRLEPIFGSVYLSAKSNKFLFDANILYDKYEGSNPLNAIKSAFEELSDDALFILSVDMPLISLNSINSLLKAYNSSNSKTLAISIASNKGLEPTATIYKREILPIIDSMYQDGDYKLFNLLNSIKTLRVKVDKRELININRLEDYQQAQALITKSII